MRNGNVMNKRILATVAGLILVAAGGAAIAQVSKQGGPVQVGADQMHSEQSTHTMFLDGRVEILQDNARLRADHAKIVYATEGGDIISMEATGNIYYVTQGAQNEQTVMKGDAAVYTKSEDTMVVTGDVILQQGQSVMSGNRLVSQVSKGITTMDAKGRVTGVFYPNKSAAPAVK